MTPDLARFVLAQDPVIDAVRAELAAGLKRTHWMWFVFPQLAGLGHSPTARHYALPSLQAARAYLAHSVLGARLIECTELVNGVDGRTAHAIFGEPDDMKFRSCMTLFGRARPGESVFAEALRKYFSSIGDERTVGLLARE